MGFSLRSRCFLSHIAPFKRWLFLFHIPWAWVWTYVLQMPPDHSSPSSSQTPALLKHRHQINHQLSLCSQVLYQVRAPPSPNSQATLSSPLSQLLSFSAFGIYIYLPSKILAYQKLSILISHLSLHPTSVTHSGHTFILVIANNCSTLKISIKYPSLRVIPPVFPAHLPLLHNSSTTGASNSVTLPFPHCSPGPHSSLLISLEAMVGESHPVTYPSAPSTWQSPS